MAARLSSLNRGTNANDDLQEHKQSHDVRVDSCRDNVLFVQGCIWREMHHDDATATDHN